MMFKIAICDDIPRVCHDIEESLMQYGKDHLLNLDIEVFYRAESVLSFIEKEHKFDLIFLDIEMEGCSGIDLSRAIRTRLHDIDTEIVFVTGTTQYDRQLFSFQPLDFIPKPVDPARLFSCLELAMRRQGQPEKYFTFNIGKDTKRIRYQEILYLEGNNRKISLVTAAEIFSYYGRLKDAMTLLPSCFCRIHKSYLVNMHQVQVFKSNQVQMNDGTVIPVGQAYTENYRDGLRREMTGGIDT